MGTFVLQHDFESDRVTVETIELAAHGQGETITDAVIVTGRRRFRVVEDDRGVFHLEPEQGVEDPRAIADVVGGFDQTDRSPRRRCQDLTHDNVDRRIQWVGLVGAFQRLIGQRTQQGEGSACLPRRRGQETDAGAVDVGVGEAAQDADFEQLRVFRFESPCRCLQGDHRLRVGAGAPRRADDRRSHAHDLRRFAGVHQTVEELRRTAAGFPGVGVRVLPIRRQHRGVGRHGVARIGMQVEIGGDGHQLSGLAEAFAQMPADASQHLSFAVGIGGDDHGAMQDEEHTVEAATHECPPGRP